MLATLGLIANICLVGITVWLVLVTKDYVQAAKQTVDQMKLQNGALADQLREQREMRIAQLQQEWEVLDTLFTDALMFGGRLVGILNTMHQEVAYDSPLLS